MLHVRFEYHWAGRLQIRYRSYSNFRVRSQVRGSFPITYFLSRPLFHWYWRDLWLYFVASIRVALLLIAALEPHFLRWSDYNFYFETAAAATPPGPPDFRHGNVVITLYENITVVLENAAFFLTCRWRISSPWSLSRARASAANSRNWFTCSKSRRGTSSKTRKNSCSCSFSNVSRFPYLLYLTRKPVCQL